MLLINGELVGNKCFPNNERIYNSLTNAKDGEDVYIQFKYELDLDISCLLFYSHYIDDKFPNSDKILRMDYVPYSRMDRQISGNIFSLKCFCNIINSLNFKKIIILDPHSNVTPALINKVEVYDNSKIVGEVISEEKPDYIYFPDMGASKKYGEQNYFKNLKYFYGNKKRNLQTGEIIGLELIDCPNDIKDKKILIVDDICSYGNTFIKSAELLKQKGCGKVILCVTHCENSIYKGGLLQDENIEKVYTTNSLIGDFSHKKIIQIY